MTDDATSDPNALVPDPVVDLTTATNQMSLLEAPPVDPVESPPLLAFLEQRGFARPSEVHPMVITQHGA